MMNFSDETVSKVKTPEFYKACGAYRTGLGGVNDIVRAALSSLTLADLMQVEEVREIVAAGGKVVKRSSDATDANYNQPMMLVYEQDLDALMVAHDKFTEAK